MSSSLQVYLSFRGRDTRKGITFELYDRLQTSGIKAVMADQDLQVGDVISPTLITAIRESRFVSAWKIRTDFFHSFMTWFTNNYKTDREVMIVYHCGSFFAVKEVSLHDQGRVSRLEQEIAFLSQFQHENIVQYYGTQKDESKLYIFLELVTKGSLQKLYQTHPLTDSHVSVYTRQILQGLKYLHDQNVIHRDIKCANILVHANGSVKLADFGLAKAIKMNDKLSRQGTANWMAPELAKPGNPGYGLPADIWSLGCTVLEMLTGKVPYPDLEWMAVLWKLMEGKLPLVPDSLSGEAQEFIHLCLQVEPDNRPTAAQLLKHPFVNKPLPPTSSGSVSPYNHHRQS